MDSLGDTNELALVVCTELRPMSWSHGLATDDSGVKMSAEKAAGVAQEAVCAALSVYGEIAEGIWPSAERVCRERKQVENRV